jgi:tartrate dehydratase alpha subunit/fumarate hydratase class I-like protein
MVTQYTSGGLSDDAIRRKLWCDVYVAAIRIGSESSTAAIMAGKALTEFGKQFPITQNTTADANK